MQWEESDDYSLNNTKNLPYSLFKTQGGRREFCPLKSSNEFFAVSGQESPLLTKEPPLSSDGDRVSPK